MCSQLNFENYNLPSIADLNYFILLLTYNKHSKKYLSLFEKISKKLKTSEYKFSFITKEKK